MLKYRHLDEKNHCKLWNIICFEIVLKVTSSHNGIQTCILQQTKWIEDEFEIFCATFFLTEKKEMLVLCFSQLFFFIVINT